MAKECKADGCSWPVFSKGLCQQHWRPLYAKPIHKNPSLKQTDQQPAKPFRVIKKVSDKQAKLNAAYKIVRDAFMKRKPVCQAQWEGCTHIATECHHSGGRRGANMLDDTKFRALCHNCHVSVEGSPERAKAEGLSEDRL